MYIVDLNWHENNYVYELDFFCVGVMHVLAQVNMMIVMLL
jgi:hypothetical protein